MCGTLRRALAWSPCILLSLTCQVPSGCGDGSAAPDKGAFDSERAWNHLVKQVEMGARPSGTEANARCRAYIARELQALGLDPKTETFKEATPAGEIEFTNVWADLQGLDAKAEMIVLGSHFDTKRMTFPFVGANDGGSSTAVLLELARVIAGQGKRQPTYRFLFLDGEEAVRFDWRNPDNTYGSRHHAAQLKALGRNTEVRAFVLLDMVGDKDLHLIRDTQSDKRILDCFFEAGRTHGLGAYLDGKALEIRDDHMSFMAIGVHSIDLIDFEYGPNNAWWHTQDDTLDKCSKESLAAVGKLVLLGLPALEALQSSR